MNEKDKTATDLCGGDLKERMIYEISYIAVVSGEIL